MTKLLKIENLLIVFYLLILGVAGYILVNRTIEQKMAMPIFIGLFCISPFVIFFRSAMRISPFVSKIFLGIFALVAVCLFIPFLNFSFCLPIPLLIVFMFIIKRERRIGFERWLKTNKFSFVPNPPEDILELLGREKNWYCYANSFFPAGGREVPFLIWFGITFSTTRTVINGSSVPTTTQNPHVALSFFPNTVSENFKQNLESANIAHKSFFQILSPKIYEQSPYLTTTLPDGTFVCAWTTLHIASILDERLRAVKALLSS
ncbi:MAG TPA: hypothetical protein VNB22_20030 [Pyrinomonadaceae bacterium]|jgi:hypothetical protein|nr:hypothetical protein [Pyrinomonadaceae bacterium]